jgi:hypothetical protein
MALVAIIPRHLRILGALIERRKVDMFGCIGWKGLLDDPESFTMDQIFRPLVERGLIEDMSSTEMGNAGSYFVRITPLGQFCYCIGYMLKEPRVASELEIKKYISDVAPMPKVPQEAFDVIKKAADEAERISGGTA